MMSMVRRITGFCFCPLKLEIRSSPVPVASPPARRAPSPDRGVGPRSCGESTRRSTKLGGRPTFLKFISGVRPRSSGTPTGSHQRRYFGILPVAVGSGGDLWGEIGFLPGVVDVYQKIRLAPPAQKAKAMEAVGQ